MRLVPAEVLDLIALALDLAPVDTGFVAFEGARLKVPFNFFLFFLVNTAMKKDILG